MSVKRVYVEKKPEFAVKAGELRGARYHFFRAAGRLCI